MQEMNAELWDRHPSIGETRNIGLFGIIELVKNRKTKEPISPFNQTSPEMVCSQETAVGKRIICLHSLAYHPDHSTFDHYKRGIGRRICNP